MTSFNTIGRPMSLIDGHAKTTGAVIVEVPSEHGPFGVRGVGEAPVVPTAAAVTNAIADATGVRMSALPMTAPRLAAAFSAAQRVVWTAPARESVTRKEGMGAHVS